MTTRPHSLKQELAAISAVKGHPFRQFRRFPREVLFDERLDSSHIDVLIALLRFSDLEKDFVQFRGVTPWMLEIYSCNKETFVRRKLLELEEFGIVSFERGPRNSITNIVWAKEYEKGLRNRDYKKFVRVPMCVIHDTRDLTAKQRHAYLVFVDWEYTSRGKHRRATDPFFLANSELARRMRANVRTARAARMWLTIYGLIEDHETMLDYKQMTATVLVPPNLRYAFVQSSYGERTWNVKFEVPMNVDFHQNVRDAMDAKEAQWFEEGQPSFDGFEYDGFEPVLYTNARLFEIEEEEKLLRSKFAFHGWHDDTPEAQNDDLGWGKYREKGDEPEAEEEVTEPPKLRVIEGDVAS